MKKKFSLPNFNDMFTTHDESMKAGKANYEKYKHTDLYKKSTPKSKALKKKTV